MIAENEQDHETEMMTDKVMLTTTTRQEGHHNSKEYCNKRTIYFVMMVGIACCLIAIIPWSIVHYKNKINNEQQYDTENDINNNDENNEFFYIIDDIFGTKIELLNPTVLDGYKTQADLEYSIDRSAYFLIGLKYNESKKISLFGEYNEGQNEYTDTENIWDWMNSSTSSTIEDVFNFNDNYNNNTKFATTTTSSLMDWNDESFNVFDSGFFNPEIDTSTGDNLIVDGDVVYAIFGSYVIVWIASSGSIIRKIQMPPISDFRNETSNDNMNDDGDGDGFDGMGSIYSSLVLLDDKLIVISQNYGSYRTDGLSHVLSNIQATHVRVYDTSYLVRNGTTTDNADTGLIGSAYLNGNLLSVTIVDGNVCIFTEDYVNTYELLISPFQRWNFPSLTDPEYEDKVRQMAPQQVQLFREALIQDLKIHGTMPTFVRMNSWVEKMSTDCGGFENFYPDGLMSRVMFVNTLDATTVDEKKTMEVSSVGIFVNYNSNVFVSGKHTLLTMNNLIQCQNDILTTSSVMISFENEENLLKPILIGIATGRQTSRQTSTDIAGDTVRVLSIADSRSHNMTAYYSENEMRTEGGINDGPPTNSVLTILSLDSTNKTNQGYMRNLSSASFDTLNIRYFGVLAYVMVNASFLSILDLNDPENPILSKPFQNPGFRGSIHLLNDDDTLLISISATGTNGVQLSMFDTAIPTLPVLLHRYNISTSLNARAWSDAPWGSKAALIGDGYIALPVDTQDWENNSTSQDRFHGYLVFKANRDEGFSEIENCRITQMIPGYGIGYIFDTEDDVFTNTTMPPVSDFLLPEVQNKQCEYCNENLDRRAFLFSKNLLMTTYGQEVISTDLQTCLTIWNITVSVDENNRTCC